MNFFEKNKITPAKVVKSVLVGFGVFVALIILIKVVNLPFGAGGGSGFGVMMQGIPSGSPTYDMAYSESGSSVSYGNNLQKTLSVRNVMSILPPRTGATGNDAEAYEVTDYNAHIESGRAEQTCAKVKELKALTYVIFENASESDKQCSYTFKVEHAKVADILSAIKALDPKDITENTNTIKQLVDDFTSQTDILKKKRDAIDKTLDSALRSYDEITVLATRTQNAEALAKIIDSKIGIIERLTQERITISAQLDELARAKNDQLDRLKYTYFNVNVYENKFFDGESLKDSWKSAVQNLVRTLNAVLQSVTVGLAGFLIWLLPIILYALIMLVVAKYAWRTAKTIWAK
ncbi:MAG: hypothetical protein EXS51_03390 [Candidatus Taylorbacteria bacterium]|nr:hypothetical protein [Candidatus Taylorbacteria bacterium]